MRRRWETVKRPRIYDRVVLRIVPLESRWVSLIARWHWDEWGHGDPSGSLEGWTAGLEKRVGREQLPLLLVAVDGDEPVGTASLVENDILSPDPRWSEIVERLRHATPWVSGVFVEPRHRRQGIASQLVEACIDRAKQLDADQLFLYTSTAQSLYERLGFAVIGREHYEEDDMAVMRRQLSLAPA